MSANDDFDRLQADNAECRRNGHDWAQYADYRTCRRCSAESSRGGDRCHNGHDWAHDMHGATCRRCLTRLSDTDVREMNRR